MPEDSLQITRGLFKQEVMPAVLLFQTVARRARVRRAVPVALLPRPQPAPQPEAVAAAWAAQELSHMPAVLSDKTILRELLPAILARRMLLVLLPQRAQPG